MFSIEDLLSLIVAEWYDMSDIQVYVHIYELIYIWIETVEKLTDGKNHLFL